MDSKKLMLQANFTPVPNAFFDEIMKKISPAETLVFLALCRRIYGWHKASDRVAMSQIQAATGLARNTAKRALAKLVKSGFIVMVKNAGPKVAAEYSINFDYESASGSKFDRLEISRGSKIDLAEGSKLTPKTAFEGPKLTPQKKVLNKVLNKEATTNRKEKDNFTELENQILSRQKSKSNFDWIKGIL
jgi:phage replication O-like protein O